MYNGQVLEPVLPDSTRIIPGKSGILVPRPIGLDRFWQRWYFAFRGNDLSGERTWARKPSTWFGYRTRNEVNWRTSWREDGWRRRLVSGRRYCCVPIRGRKAPVRWMKRLRIWWASAYRRSTEFGNSSSKKAWSHRCTANRPRIDNIANWMAYKRPTWWLWPVRHRQRAECVGQCNCWPTNWWNWRSSSRLGGRPFAPR